VHDVLATHNIPAHVALALVASADQGMMADFDA
jgi:hypothetical protein